jgi:ComF family protein
MFSKLLISLIDILLPRACLLCRMPTREQHHLCRPCAKELPILSHSCVKCAQFLPFPSEQICGQCLTDPPPFDFTFALFPYFPPIPHFIAGLKFEQQFSFAQLFSCLMTTAVLTQWYPNHRLPDLIIPMPLHARRLKERGYNQAAEIAKPLARALQIPLDHGIIRSKYTQPQSALPASLRPKNTANAFSALRSYQGVHIAVVDDVMTTGETVTAIARLLKRYGAGRVDIWCCARCDNRL